MSSIGTRVCYTTDPVGNISISIQVLPTWRFPQFLPTGWFHYRPCPFLASECSYKVACSTFLARKHSPKKGKFWICSWWRLVLQNFFKSVKKSDEVLNVLVLEEGVRKFGNVGGCWLSFRFSLQHVAFLVVLLTTSLVVWPFRHKLDQQRHCMVFLALDVMVF